MEIIVGILLLTAGFFAGNNKQQTEAPKQTQVNECVQMCNSGTVAEYKWCKCQTKTLWSK